MSELDNFIQTLINCNSISEKEEFFKKRAPDDYRIYVFDEIESEFARIGKPIIHGKFEMIGLGDYRKTWILDKEMNEKQYVCAKKIVNYDLNILTYIDSLYRDRIIPDKENFIKFLSEIKESSLRNNISTALMERYATPLKKDILAKMIKSYVYFDSLEFEEFKVSPKKALFEDKYIKMKEIWNDAEGNLAGNNNNYREYDVIYCYILKAFILKNKKNLSSEAKINKFKEYCLNELSVFLELEFNLLVLFLKNDNLVQKVFEKLQINAKDILDKISNTTWDIFHIRLLEKSIFGDYKKNKDEIILHYFATADSALSSVLKIYPIKMLVCSDEKYVPIRELDTRSFFSEDEWKMYNSERNLKIRAENVNRLDYKSIKKSLIGELESLLAP